MEEFTTGLQRCLEDPPAPLRGARLGLLANRASVTADGDYAWQSLADRFPGQLTTVFSPQHGLWCGEQANMIETPHGFLESPRVPLYSLYSETRKPTAAMLADVDCLLVDLQDVGTRIYTFVWTVMHCLEACAERDIRVVVLDRPNPIDGATVEGRCLDLQFASFVGLAPIPMRHGLTLGELARFVNETCGIGATLDVVAMTGWHRRQYYEDLRAPWTAPSPNMPRCDTALVYPGMVLLEGTNVSEGRGTARPFQVCGAPWIDARKWQETLQDFDLVGVEFDLRQFLPTFDKWEGRQCQGLELRVTDRDRFRPLHTAAVMLATLRQLWPDAFCWNAPPYEYETEKLPIDILAGTDELRLAVDSGDLAPLQSWAEEDPAWPQQAEPFRLYPP